MTDKQRCFWCTTDPLYIRYHDEEWGAPEHCGRALFESLCLEGQQAGLSWITILRKREHYRRVFAHFDPHKIAQFSDAQLNKLLLDEGIVRHRLKVYGLRKNAQVYLEHFDQAPVFSQFIWSFVDGAPVHRHGQSLLSTSPQSDALSKALKKRGFTFVGSTICYAFMQANGLVNDHDPSCWMAKKSI